MSGRARAVIGVLVSVLLLAWALRDVSFGEVTGRIASADPLLFGISIAVALIGFWIRAIRWGILLLPVTSDVPFRPRVAATFIGFAANNVLPARIGEVARAVSLARLTRVPGAAAFATLVIERTLDGLVLVAILFVAMALPSFPGVPRIAGVDPTAAAASIAAIMLLVTTGLFLATAAPRRAAGIGRRAVEFLPKRFQGAALRLLRGFATGLVVMRTPGLFAASAALALVQWVFLALSYFAGFRAFHIEEVPFSGALFLQSVISLAVAIPSSPGFFGPFEAAARVGLGVWDVPAGEAISFAIGYHIGGFIPVTLIGIYYLWSLNLRLSDMSDADDADPNAPPTTATGPEPR